MTLHLTPPRIQRPRRPSRGAPVPPLVNGDHLKQPEFHRRYEAMPEGFKAELIGGIVYVASPMRNPHGRHTILLGALLGHYEAATPGVEGADGVTVILGDASEPQPDLCLRILPEHGGRSKEDEDEYLTGPPELVIEVAHSTEAIDLRGKLADYRAGGVREYLVFCVTPGELRAFRLDRNGRPAVVKDDTYRSTEFPGLWIDVGALAAKDMRAVLAAGQEGVASDEHVTFVKRLRERAKPRRGRRGK